MCQVLWPDGLQRGSGSSNTVVNLVFTSCGWFCGFGSESTSKAQWEKEKAALQQSLHTNSALLSDKEQQVEGLRSQVSPHL